VQVSMRRYPLYGGATGGFDTPALGVTVGQPGRVVGVEKGERCPERVGCSVVINQSRALAPYIIDFGPTRSKSLRTPTSLADCQNP
jgi:hypothetical protein